MTRQKKDRRVTPALVVAVIALVAAVSGTAVAAQINGNRLAPKSVGGGKLKPKTVHGSKLKQFTGGLIKRQTLPAAKLVPDSLGGDQIDESKLGTVPSAERLAGGFKVKLAFGETAELATVGPFKLTAQCVQNGTDAAGTTGRDYVRVLLETSEAGSVFTSGVGALPGNAPDRFLNPDTAEADRIVDEVAVNTGNSNYKPGGHFSAMAPSGAGLSSPQGSTSAALNLFDAGCSLQGTATANS